MGVVSVVGVIWIAAVVELGVVVAAARGTAFTFFLIEVFLVHIEFFTVVACNMVEAAMTP